MRHQHLFIMSAKLMKIYCFVLAISSVIQHIHLYKYQVLTLTLLYVCFFSPANYEYAAACLPTSRGSTENCYIQLLSNATANVEIHRINDYESFRLPAYEVYQREYEDFP